MARVRIDDSQDPERIAKAIRRYRSYKAVRNTLLLPPFFLFMIVFAITVFNLKGFWWAAGATFLGFWVFGVMLTWLIALPLGYLFWGRDAMRVAHLVEDRRS